MLYLAIAAVITVVLFMALKRKSVFQKNLFSHQDNMLKKARFLFLVVLIVLAIDIIDSFFVNPALSYSTNPIVFIEIAYIHSCILIIAIEGNLLVNHELLRRKNEEHLL